MSTLPGLVLIAPCALALSVRHGLVLPPTITKLTGVQNAPAREPATARQVSASAILDTLVMLASVLSALTVAPDVGHASHSTSLPLKLVNHISYLGTKRSTKVASATSAPVDLTAPSVNVHPTLMLWEERVPMKDVTALGVEFATTPRVYVPASADSTAPDANFKLSFTKSFVEKYSVCTGARIPRIMLPLAKRNNMMFLSNGASSPINELYLGLV
jgi:hypothetical protein